jgi:hypothetical protein
MERAKPAFLLQRLSQTLVEVFTSTQYSKHLLAKPQGTIFSSWGESTKYTTSNKFIL